MAWEENSRICLHMQLIAILSRIGVLYGTNISYRNIKEIELKSNLPDIKSRSNGFAAGYTRLGNFITQDDSHIMLFTHSDSCFIRIVTKTDEIYYLSCQESDETVKIFKEIKRHL